MAVPEVTQPRVPLRLVVLLALAHLSFAGSRLVLTLQAVNLHASPLAVGIILSLLMVVPTFVAVPIGRWTDRAGFKQPAVFGFALLALAGVLAALFPDLLVLGAVSVLVGSGYMLAHVAVNNAIGQASTPSTRSSSFGAMAVAFSISGLVGPMLAGFVIDHGGHAAAFALLVIFPLLSALLLVFPAPLPAYASGRAVSKDNTGVMDLLRHARLREVFILSGLMSMGWDLFSFLVPLHGVHSGLSATAIGLVVGAFGAGNFAVRLAIPLLMRSFGEWQLMRVALALTAACYVAFPFFTSLQALLPLAFLIGVVLGCGQPMAMSLVHLVAPPSRTGEAVGVRSMITSISQTVLPLMFGALGTAVGMVPVFWAAATVLASGSAYARRDPSAATP